jgi:lipopolysaccharide export system permease protein
MRWDRYIVGEWLKVFGLTVATMLGLLLIDDVKDELRTLLDYGADAAAVLNYYRTLLPSYLPITLPVALVVSLLLVLGNLHRNLEITAMRAAGLSLWRITRGLWLMGALLTGLLFELNSRVVPHAVEHARRLWNEYQFAHELSQKQNEEAVGLLFNLTFLNHSAGHLWFLNRFNEYNYRAYGITVSQLDPAGREVTRIMANEGWFDESAGHWFLVDGREMSFDPESGDPVRSLGFASLAASHLRDAPDLMKFLEKRPKDLSLRELHRIVGALSGQQDPRLVPYEVQYFGMLFNPLSCLLVVGFAIPFAVSGVRTNPFVGVAKAMGLFFLYYLAVSICALLGRGGLHPLAAALLPNVAALGCILHFLHKAMRPS